jgi:nucleoside 2-deoxyribosyltransferase
MAFKVFLSHSTAPEEQALVWRLQTLATAHGLHVIVPQRAPASTRKQSFISEAVRSAIDQSDCVLAIITTRTPPAVQQELSYAMGKVKLIIPLVEAAVANQQIVRSFDRVFLFSHDEYPGKVENKVVQFLNEQRISKENRQALGALIAIGLGMLLLQSVGKE